MAKNKQGKIVVAKKGKARAAQARAGVAKTAVARPANPTFGPVSTISTAPVAIGNSMSGFKTQVLHTADGCRVIGRDYAFTPAATGNVTGWALTGGMPDRKSVV